MKQRSLLRHLGLFLMLLLFFLLPFRPLQTFAASDPNVPALAKKHTLASAQIKKTGASGKNLVCVSKGKRLKKKRFWFCIKGKIYYNNAKAKVQTGAFTYKGFHYLAGNDGALRVNTLANRGGAFFYYASTGVMVANGWHYTGGAWRFFEKNGIIRINQWIDGAYVGFDGAVISGLKRSWQPWNPASDRSGYVATAANASEKHLIIIGASRVVQMSQDVPKDPRITFIANSGMGIEWLNQSVLPLLDFWLSVYPASKVVIQLGNNGLKPVKKAWPGYRAAYQYLLNTYPWVSFYFMDILPGSLTGSQRKNKMRRQFNAKLKNAFPKQWIGGYDYMMEKGFGTVDAIHFDTATNRMLYSYILRKAGW